MLIYLNLIALRAIQDLWDATGKVPDATVLSLALEEYARARLGAVIFWVSPGDPAPSVGERWMRVPEAALADLCSNVAFWTLNQWTPTYMEQRRASGRIGGQRSRRGPAWSGTDLMRLLTDLHGQTVTQQAVALGYSNSTISRMRRELRGTSS